MDSLNSASCCRDETNSGIPAHESYKFDQLDGDIFAAPNVIQKPDVTSDCSTSQLIMQMDNIQVGQLDDAKANGLKSNIGSKSGNIYELPKIKNGLAKFGIDDFDELDSTTQFGLASILMGMKVRRQSENHVGNPKSGKEFALLQKASPDLKLNHSSSANSKTRKGSRGNVAKNANVNNAAFSKPSGSKKDVANVDYDHSFFKMFENFERNKPRSPYQELQSTFNGSDSHFHVRKSSDVQKTKIPIIHPPFDETSTMPDEPDDASVREQHDDKIPSKFAPFVAWQQPGFLADSDIHAVFGDDDISAAGLRAIICSSASNSGVDNRNDQQNIKNKRNEI
jgi:hypothetical protein